MFTWRQAPNKSHTLNTYLVGQFLVQLLGYGHVELSLEVPRRDPDSVDHLHQHEHGADRERRHAPVEWCSRRDPSVAILHDNIDWFQTGKESPAIQFNVMQYEIRSNIQQTLKHQWCSQRGFTAVKFYDMSQNLAHRSLTVRSIMTFRQLSTLLLFPTALETIGKNNHFLLYHD